MLNQKSKELRYFVATGLFNFGRVLPHAVLTVILLAKGMDLAQISIIQSLYMISSLLFEFPSGVLSDLISEKYMYMLSLVFIIISYTTTMLTQDFGVLCLSWFIYGLSMAAMSGTLDTYFIKAYKKQNTDFKPFLVWNNYVFLYSSLIAGALGAVIYSFLKEGVYLFSNIAFLLSLVIIIFLKLNVKTHVKEISHINQTKFKMFVGYMQEAVKEVWNNKPLLFVVLQIVAFQIILQIYFQYWQVIFLDRGISSTYFGGAYFMMQILGIGSNYLFKRLNITIKRESIIVICMALLFMISMNVKDVLLFLGSFYCFQLFFNLYFTSVQHDMSKYAPHEILSSITSMVGTLTTLSSAVVLLAIASLLQYMTLYAIINTCIIFFVVVSSILIFIRIKYYQRELSSFNIL